MKTTIVTALFDINRDVKGDGRTIDEYLIWFDETLKLNCNMVIYTEEKFKEFILSKRKNKNTKIIIQNLNEIPYYKYNDEINSIINSDEYKSKIKDNSRVECKLSLYNVIQYSKFSWIEETIKNYYFDSEYYFWMDAGCSRFFDGVDTNIEWISDYSILNKDKLNIQGNSNSHRYNYIDDETYIWDCNCLLVGTLFGGGKDICLKISELVNSYFENKLKENKVNNEQIILAILWKKYPELFNVYVNINGKHLPFFKKLSYLN